MGKKSKTYRGQRKSKRYLGCGCFYCTGYDKQDVINIKEKIIDNETNKIINNFDLHCVSNNEVAVCDTCLHFPRNISNRRCAECDDGDNWEAN